MADVNQIFNNVTKLDYYGTNFTSLNTTPNVESLENGKFLELDGYSNSSQPKGRIVVSGSGYFAENYMLSSSNSNYINDCKFVLNLLTWLKDYSSLTISCRQKSTDQKIRSYQFTTSETNNSGTGYHEIGIISNFGLITFFLMIPLVALVRQRSKRRKM